MANVVNPFRATSRSRSHRSDDDDDGYDLTAPEDFDGATDGGWRDDTDDLDDLLDEISDDDIGGLLSPEDAENARERRRLSGGGGLGGAGRFGSSTSGDHARAGAAFYRKALLAFVGVVLLIALLGGRGGEEAPGGLDVEGEGSGPSKAVGGGEGKNATAGGGSEGEHRVEVKRIAILGERKSGVQWVATKIAECYPQLEVEQSLQRSGHYFQDPPPEEPFQMPTLVLATFLNPYDWVTDMRLHPHKTPEHTNMDWHDYVTTPWTTTRPKRDEDMKNKEGNVCRMGFEYDRIVSCAKGDDSPDDPTYELKLDGSGQAYGSVVDLRADKIRNFLGQDEYEYVAGVVPVRYEDLVGDVPFDGMEEESIPGIVRVLVKIEQMTGELPSCDVTENGGKDYRAPLSLFDDHDAIEPEFMEWMNQHADWDAEALIGYERWSSVPDLPSGEKGSSWEAFGGGGESEGEAAAGKAGAEDGADEDDGKGHEDDGDEDGGTDGDISEADDADDGGGGDAAVEEDEGNDGPDDADADGAEEETDADDRGEANEEPEKKKRKPKHHHAHTAEEKTSTTKGAKHTKHKTHHHTKEKPDETGRRTLRRGGQ